MSYIKRNSEEETFSKKKKKKKIYKRVWFKIVSIILILLLIGGGIFAWKAGSVLKKISKGNIISSLVHSLPGVNSQIKGEKEGRVNILLLGMRGANDPAGGTLADTIMVASIKPKENKISLISIPRDLFVDNPAVGYKTKINAVYAYGEKKGKGQGINYMEQEVGDVSGLPIQYAITVNFDGFKQLIDATGGVKITLDKPFEESVQFDQSHICNSFFTVPTGETKDQTVKFFSKERNTYRTRIVRSYPLCTAPKDTLECGGDFKLSAGDHMLNGEQALCFARARETSNDFERAKRQQQIIQAVKAKLLSMGTLTNFSKLNSILDSLGNNVKTDMQPWEMKRLYDLYNQTKDYQLYQRVIDASDNSEFGLVYGKKDPTFGDILLPKGDNFDKIHALFQNIFTLSPQENETSPSDTNNMPSSSDTLTTSPASTSPSASTMSNE